ncbi:hypothetical protein C1J00_05010 [Streptomyces cahuitamycinicus]|uniref:Transposase n=1 Tax=Streptomyces cahuitamycinicus TaxID=2070367 RepID=A0A2N8TW62_9ACTN|nr:hypothetical protein C1J00_05010 [Streptomyces cahuitamycinicus]
MPCSRRSPEMRSRMLSASVSPVLARASEMRTTRLVAPSRKNDQAANRRKKGSRGGRPVTHDPGLYRDRNTVERAINKMKDWRGIATRYDRSPESYLPGLPLSAQRPTGSAVF